PGRRVPRPRVHPAPAGQLGRRTHRHLAAPGPGAGGCDGPRGRRPGLAQCPPARPNPGMASHREPVPAAASAPVPCTVLLIHGISNAGFWLSSLAAKLRAAGFAPRIWTYDSVRGGGAAAARALGERLRDGPEIDIVGHSLGGLVALEALRL